MNDRPRTNFLGFLVVSAIGVAGGVFVGLFVAQCIIGARGFSYTPFADDLRMASWVTGAIVGWLGSLVYLFAGRSG